MKKAQNSPDFQSWRQTLGPDFDHIHHYCVALNFVNRSYRARRPEDKRFNLTSAINNFSYVVTHAKQTFSLMPEVYLNRGLAYSLSRQEGLAVKDLEKALELDPKSAKAYVGLSDYFVEHKQKAKALELVTEGLKHAPNNKALMRRYDELGGKKPYPEPYVRAEPVAAEPGQGETREEPPEASASSGETPAKAKETLKKVAPAGDALPAKAPVADSSVPTEGARRNPWCRFCPDEDRSSNRLPSTPATDATSAE
jgi:tetratricopeptide (TPR) repeat protein